MTSEVVTVLCGGSALDHPVFDRFYDNRTNLVSPCKAYQELLETSDRELIVYAHDDLSVYELGWYTRLMALFENPQCVAAGFGGALALGNMDLFRKPFNVWNLARRGYGDNQDNAEVHGTRFTGTRRVAVLEQYCMAIRTDWLWSKGGWPVEHLRHHMLDAFIACEAARDGRELWQVGVRCQHHGGGTSTTPAYAKAKWLDGGTMEQDHSRAHRWIFASYKDVFPLEVNTS